MVRERTTTVALHLLRRAARAAVSLRLFVALDLPEPARAALAAFRDAAADPEVWRPVPDASLHVTLAFLGHRPEEHAGAVAAVLRGLEDRPAPPLSLGAALLLPPRRARVLAVALEDPDGRAGAAAGATWPARSPAAGLYEPEARPFRPHVTVARLRTGREAAARGRTRRRSRSPSRRAPSSSTARTSAAAAPPTSRSPCGRSAERLQSPADDDPAGDHDGGARGARRAGGRRARRGGAALARLPRGDGRALREAARAARPLGRAAGQRRPARRARAAQRQAPAAATSCTSPAGRAAPAWSR